MYYDKAGGHYFHSLCEKVRGRNNRKTKKQLSVSTPKRFDHPEIGKCLNCKGYDLKDHFDGKKRFHRFCGCIQTKNSAKMKKHKTDTCAFTGLPFGSTSETRPMGDHDHDTLLYRGHIWAAANRFEGALKSLMNGTGASLEEVFEMARTYYAKPGIDIGLEPYPVLGFTTPEEALQHYEKQNNDGHQEV